MVRKNIELINQDISKGTISIKILEVNLGYYILDNSKWDKISESIAKKSISGTD